MSVRVSLTGAGVSICLLQVQDLESALLASQGEAARQAERRRASQLEAQRSEAAARARSSAAAAVEVAAAREAALDDTRGALAVAPHDWTAALANLSVEPAREKEKKGAVEAVPLKPANDDPAEAPFASFLVATRPTRGPPDASDSTRRASDAPAAVERSTAVDDEDGADLSSLLLDQLPEMRYWGALPAPPSAKAPGGEIPLRPALAHATNAQVLLRQGGSCQADEEPAAGSRPPRRSVAAAPAFGYGAELLDLLDQLENTPPQTPTN
jgi:hypothetical protein